MATVGEFVAGLALLGAFDPTEYRLIMSHMEVEYKRRAVTQIRSRAALSEDDLAEVRWLLKEHGLTTRVLTSSLMDDAGEEVAVVRTNWQIKAWGRIEGKVGS